MAEEVIKSWEGVPWWESLLNLLGLPTPTDWKLRKSYEGIGMSPFAEKSLSSIIRFGVLPYAAWRTHYGTDWADKLKGSTVSAIRRVGRMAPEELASMESAAVRTPGLLERLFGRVRVPYTKFYGPEPRDVGSIVMRPMGDAVTNAEAMSHELAHGLVGQSERAVRDMMLRMWNLL